MEKRREFLKKSCALFAGLILYSCKLDTKKEEKTLVNIPGKKPLILLTDRPINVETPLSYFLEDFTPNDAFFVRWHTQNVPSQIDLNAFRLKIFGNVDNEVLLSMDDLKTKFKPYTINAVCVCAGNARSCFSPRVAGAQWVNGGMGNAKWTGVKLSDILEYVGLKSDSKFVSFNGLDSSPLATVPDFVKSLDVSHAMDGDVMVAYEMNGEQIPLLNGYPLKLVVPGWYATYWIKMLGEIKVSSDTMSLFWMDKAYQVPKGIENGNEAPDTLAKETIPISRIFTRSLFVSPEPNKTLNINGKHEIQGLAFDGGSGIEKVEISVDNGKSWILTKLDTSLGNYSWRRWRFNYETSVIGEHTFLIKATNTKGETQPEHQWNRSGYMRSEIESITLNFE